MKRIIAVILLMTVFHIQAQEGQQDRRDERKSPRGQMMQDMSAEELATLKTKRMTLDLNLSESQKKDIYDINLKAAQEKKAKFAEREARKNDENREKPSKDEIYQNMNDRLDQQIAHKQSMRQILDDDQFKRWEKQGKRQASAKRRHHQGKRQGKMRVKQRN